MPKVHVLLVQGWGDNESEFYPMGVYKSKAKAEWAMDEMLDQYENDGNDRDSVEFDIQEFAVEE